MATKSPGIYVNEIDNTTYVNVKATTGTNVCVIGYARKGPIGVPTEIYSYNAFIKTPVQGALPPGYATPLGPSMMDITLPDNNLDITRGVVGSAEEVAYQSYLNNITPEQNRMRLERDPNIKTVVVYNQETGARYFDVIDTRTGQSVPNVAKPDDFLLDNMTINVRSGTARNSDANLDFGLIVVGNRGMNDF